MPDIWQVSINITSIIVTIIIFAFFKNSSFNYKYNTCFFVQTHRDALRYSLIFIIYWQFLPTLYKLHSWKNYLWVFPYNFLSQMQNVSLHSSGFTGEDDQHLSVVKA